MYSQKKLIVSHAPFIHNGSRVPTRNYHILLAALPAVLVGLYQYGIPAVGVVALSVSSAILWELVVNFLRKSDKTIGDGNAAVIGLIFAMLLPATVPWWFVITGTFFAVVVGQQIFGGIGSNPFNPVVLGALVLFLGWRDYFDFNVALVNYDFGFDAIYPLSALKTFGASGIQGFTPGDLLLAKQTGGIGSTFGLGLIVGGIYLMIRGIIRWEISLSFLVGIVITSLIFNMVAPDKYAGPMFHLFAGYTLIGAFFLAPEDSSSPVNFIPMLIFGLVGGFMTILIRNIGAYVDGVLFAILLINLLAPIFEKIRPKALGKVD
jgi:Na+-translocating ferredoxin:NAD+ oxidoreductase subunit D